MSKAVILGDGLLGSELHRITNWPIESRRRTNLDIEDFKRLSYLVTSNDIIVNCIEHTNS